MKRILHRLLRTILLAMTLSGIFNATVLFSQTKENRIDSFMPIRGLSIAAPYTNGMDLFLKFIEEELAPAHFNLLILHVNWNYAYESHPELRGIPYPLTKSDVKKIVGVCRRYGIRIAPSIDLLGHQSWAKTTGDLLRVYPEFDETPQIKTENYSGWPNADNLYCKSYCPLHPGVHAVVFALIDELMDVFETDLFHAGMDEVFYIADLHLNDMLRFRQSSSPEMASQFQGIIEMVWEGTDNFLKSYYDPATDAKTVSNAGTLKQLMEKFKKMGR